MNTEPAHRWLESQFENMVVDLIAACNQNSGSQNLEGLNRLADWLSNWMGLPQSNFQRISLPPRQSVSDDGQAISVETGPALRWDYQPQCDRRVLLMIHYDTVFGPAGAFQTCERLSASQLRGPGVADAKGGIVVLRYALQALQKFGLSSQLGWTVLLNPDEEVGSQSSAPLMQELAPKFDFGLLFEPALPTGAMISDRKGSGGFTILVRGRSAHAGRHFEEGRNAVTELCRMVAAIDELNGQRPGTIINVGYVAGGGAVNIVPDSAVARLNVRVVDLQSADWFVDQLRRLTQVTAAREGYHSELHGCFQSPPKRAGPEQLELMRCIEASAGKLQQPIKWQHTGGVCDGNKLAAAGLPNIDTLGPLGDGLHSHQECVQLDSLVDKAKLLVEILCGYAAGEYDSLRRSKVTYIDYCAR